GGSGGTAPVGLAPFWSGVATFAAALIGGLVPLAPFLLLPLPAAVAVSVATSVAALFGLGLVIGRVSGTVPWRDGVRLVLIGSVAALAAALVGAALPVDCAGLALALGSGALVRRRLSPTSASDGARPRPSGASRRAGPECPRSPRHRSLGA
ncbi:MAG: VIT1/CCC1 transporter family protein, partial [Chloroflexota bacterium]